MCVTIWDALRGFLQNFQGCNRFALRCLKLHQLTSLVLDLSTSGLHSEPCSCIRQTSQRLAVPTGIQAGWGAERCDRRCLVDLGGFLWAILQAWGPQESHVDKIRDDSRYHAHDFRRRRRETRSRIYNGTECPQISRQLSGADLVSYVNHLLTGLHTKRCIASALTKRHCAEEWKPKLYQSMCISLFLL